MRLNFAKKSVAISMCTFVVALLGAALDAASFEYSLLPVAQTKTVYLVVNECHSGKMAAQLPQEIAVNRDQVNALHKLSRKKF